MSVDLCRVLPNRVCWQVEEASGASWLSLRFVPWAIPGTVRGAEATPAQARWAGAFWSRLVQLLPTAPQSTRQHPVSPGVVVKEMEQSPSCYTVAGALLQCASPLPSARVS